MPAERPPSDVDVAFSFLARDEAVALEISRMMQASARTFVFSERQKELAGTDGVVQFTKLFQDRAKLVVVLYRDGYASTKWTRIEESAITSRGLNLGWDSLFLISLDGARPKWLPASRLWYGIEQFGARFAAEVILARLHDLVQAGRPESLVEQARAVSRQIASRVDGDRWRSSEDGVKAALEELTDLRMILQQQADAISEVSADLRMQFFEPEANVIGIRLARAKTTFGWINQYSNTIREAYLFVREQVLTEGPSFNREWEPVRELHMGLWLADGGLRVWIAQEEPKRSFTTRELAEWHLKKLLDRVKARLEEGPR